MRPAFSIAGAARMAGRMQVVIFAVTMRAEHSSCSATAAYSFCATRLMRRRMGQCRRTRVAKWCRPSKSSLAEGWWVRGLDPPYVRANSASRLVDDFAGYFEAGGVDAVCCGAGPGDFGFHAEVLGRGAHRGDERSRIFHRGEVRDAKAAVGNVFSCCGEGCFVERPAAAVERDDVETDRQRAARFDALVGSGRCGQLAAGGSECG